MFDAHRLTPVAALRLVALGALVTTAAHAGIRVPDGPCSTVPCSIALVGSNGGVADPAGAFQVVVRSVTCTPLPGSTVTIDFGACTPDIHIGSAQISPVTVDCAGRRVSAVTDANGIARFIVLGGASNPTGATPGYTAQGFCQSVPTCAKVYADGFLLASIAVSTYDQNMSGGVNPADVSAWLGDIFSGQYFGRSDYDANGLLSPVDLSKLLGVSLNHRSTSSSAAYCN